MGPSAHACSNLQHVHEMFHKKSKPKLTFTRNTETWGLNVMFVRQSTINLLKQSAASMVSTGTKLVDKRKQTFVGWRKGKEFSANTASTTNINSSSSSTNSKTKAIQTNSTIIKLICLFTLNTCSVLLPLFFSWRAEVTIYFKITSLVLSVLFSVVDGWYFSNSSGCWWAPFSFLVSHQERLSQVLPKTTWAYHLQI